MSTELNNIDLTPNQRKAVAELLKRYIPDTEVWAYGSRVKFSSTPKSDLDLVAFATPEQKRAISNLKEAFEESSLPFRVDLFIWNEVPEQFHKNIEAERVVFQKKNENRWLWKRVEKRYYFRKAMLLKLLIWGNRLTSGIDLCKRLQLVFLC